jgi:hypothetical protein
MMAALFSGEGDERPRMLGYDRPFGSDQPASIRHLLLKQALDIVQGAEEVGLTSS